MTKVTRAVIVGGGIGGAATAPPGDQSGAAGKGA